MLRKKTQCHDLIPGLPSDLAIECLVRVPYRFHSTMKSVNRSWRALLSDSDSSFTVERRRCNKTELLLCLVQPLLSTNPVINEKKKKLEDETQKQTQTQTRVFLTTPRFGLSVYNATMDTWNRVAFREIPVFCECVVLQDAEKILLIGGWDPVTLLPARDIYVLELFTGRWKRGAPMKESRSFFACVSIGATKVYVAGGHDEEKNALNSAEVYDAEKDEWSTISPMNQGRDECQGFRSATGRFCVLSGYGTESQGKFRSDGEIYDPVTDSWSVIGNLWPFPDISPRGRIAGDYPKSDIEDIQLPATGNAVFAGMVNGVMKMKKNGKWSQIKVPSGFSTLPFSHDSIYV